MTPPVTRKPVEAAKRLLDREDASQYRLRADEEVADGIRRVATGRAESAIDHLRGRGEEEPAAAVHETRKDMKKLRSVLRLVWEPLGDGTFRARELALPRGGARALGPARRGG